MRGPFYVITALLVTVSSRAAADPDLVKNLQPANRVSAAPSDEERVLPSATLKSLEEIGTSLLKPLAEREKVISAAGNAVEKTTLNLPHSVPPGPSVTIEATMSRISKDSVTENAASELSDEIGRQRQQLTHPSLDESAQMEQPFVHSGASASIDAFLPKVKENWLNTKVVLRSAEDIYRQDAPSGFGVAINAPSHTRSIKKQFGPPLDSQRHWIKNNRKDPHVSEQILNSFSVKVGPTLSQHTADHQFGPNLIEIISRGRDEGPPQIPLPVDPAILQNVAEVHEQFTKYQKLPCPQTMRETYKMLHIYKNRQLNNVGYSTVAERFEVLTERMSTEDLESAMGLGTVSTQHLGRAVKKIKMKSQDVLTSASSNYVLLWVDDYWKMLREAHGYRSMMKKRRSGAVLLDHNYLLMLQNAYYLKSKIVYELFYSFCTDHSALCTNIIEKPLMPKRSYTDAFT